MLKPLDGHQINKISILLFILMMINLPCFAQLCKGSFGDPVIKMDFGRGTDEYGPSIGTKTNYQYLSSGIPDDGFYAIPKNTNNMYGIWHKIINHTPNDPDGYMLVANADYTPGIFYEEEVETHLCPNTNYRFGAWVINLMAVNGIKPNLVFHILTLDNQILGELVTGDIPEDPNANWKEHVLEFNTRSVDKVKIRITNNGPGGVGNDIAIDDITFRACGPEIKTSINGVEQINKSICEGKDEELLISTEIEESATLQYQWQEFSANTWTDIPGETNSYIAVKYLNPVQGLHQYRVVIAKQGNFSSVVCRTFSDAISVVVEPPPVPIVTPDLTTCIGESFQLSASGGSTYKWTYPNGESSDEQSPTITATADMEGIYKVLVTSVAGCETSATVKVTLTSRPVPTVGNIDPICKGEPVTLNAGGGLTYRWVPATGLSATDIPDPIATPGRTTTYTVYVSNGYCESAAQVTVKVIQPLAADAGPDQKIIKGNSIIIKGDMTGENIGQFFWTPAEYLDDPLKINPIAKPPVSTTYTLNVISSSGCISSSDEVFIKVYDKFIVPSAFSPNGDGINDIWNVTAIDTYANPTVKVMNRYGQLMFEGNRDKTAWNGKRGNEDVPVGVYYYMIYLEPGLKPLTGSLMVIR